MDQEVQQPQAAFERYSEMAQQSFQEYPIGITLGFFAAGLGLGAMIGASLAQPMGLTHQPTTAEALGRRVLDAIGDYLPDPLQRTFRG
jgi:hypothetical protein